MRTRPEIQARIRGLLVMELDRRIADAARRKPRACVHNHRHTLDSRKLVDGEVNESYNRITKKHLPVLQTVGLCMLGSDDPENWSGTICEDDLDAQRCPDFTSSLTKDDVIDSFRVEISNGDWLMTNLPEVSQLLWALGEAESPPLPFWKRLWFRWILRIDIEAPTQLNAAENLDALLLESSHDANSR